MKETQEFELRKVLRDVTLERASEKVASLPEAVATGSPIADRESGGSTTAGEVAWFEGPGWTMELRQLSSIPVGRMTMEQLEMRIRGSEESVTDLWERLQYKFLRGGA